MRDKFGNHLNALWRFSLIRSTCECVELIICLNFSDLWSSTSFKFIGFPVLKIKRFNDSFVVIFLKYVINRQDARDSYDSHRTIGLCIWNRQKKTKWIFEEIRVERSGENGTLTLYDKYTNTVVLRSHHRHLNLPNILHILPWHLLKRPLQMIQSKCMRDNGILANLFDSNLPLYDKRGFVRHITKWHSISSGNTNLLHTGHLIPANI